MNHPNTCTVLTQTATLGNIDGYGGGWFEERVFWAAKIVAG